MSTLIKNSEERHEKSACPLGPSGASKSDNEPFRSNKEELSPFALIDIGGAIIGKTGQVSN
jgi:hypothetical protein